MGPHPIGAFVNNLHDINRGRPDLALEEVSRAGFGMQEAAIQSVYWASRKPR